MRKDDRNSWINAMRHLEPVNPVICPKCKVEFNSLLPEGVCPDCFQKQYEHPKKEKYKPKGDWK